MCKALAKLPDYGKDVSLSNIFTNCSLGFNLPVCEKMCRPIAMPKPVVNISANGETVTCHKT